MVLEIMERTFFFSSVFEILPFLPEQGLGFPDRASPFKVDFENDSAGSFKSIRELVTEVLKAWDSVSDILLKNRFTCM